MAFEDYKGLLKKLRREFPKIKADVRRVKINPADCDDGDGEECDAQTIGWCDWRPEKRKFYIRISNELSEDFASWVLIHEWAHAVAWKKPGGVHGPEWGKAYSRCYRIWADE